MNMKLELVPADKAEELLERILRIRNPRLWELRRKQRAQVLRKARKEGRAVKPFEAPGWHYYTDKLLPMNSFAAAGLTDLNRELSSSRVELYVEEMAAGKWRFSPDPIVVTEDGYLVNGQHRLVAATKFDWKRPGVEIPPFLVVWGVDKKTALLMDEAQRSTNDRRQIALGFAEAVQAAA
jgi:hypothetical protein